VTDRNPAKSSGSTVPDPVGELFYRIQIEDLTIGLFTEATGIGVEYDALTVEEGGNNGFQVKLRGRAKYPNLVLKRGVTHETALLEWFRKCEQSVDYRTVFVNLVAPDAEVVRSWSFLMCWPVKWTGPNLKGGSNAAATETLEIAHMGFIEVDG
jgi:phage tail-like protein